MKCCTLAFAVLFFGGIVSAQQSATVQLQCHDLASSSNYRLRRDGDKRHGVPRSKTGGYP